MNTLSRKKKSIFSKLVYQLMVVLILFYHILVPLNIIRADEIVATNSSDSASSDSDTDTKKDSASDKKSDEKDETADKSDKKKADANNDKPSNDKTAEKTEAENNSDDSKTSDTSENKDVAKDQTQDKKITDNKNTPPTTVDNKNESKEINNATLKSDTGNNVIGENEPTPQADVTPGASDNSNLSKNNPTDEKSTVPVNNVPTAIDNSIDSANTEHAPPAEDEDNTNTDNSETESDLASNETLVSNNDPIVSSDNTNSTATEDSKNKNKNSDSQKNDNDNSNFDEDSQNNAKTKETSGLEDTAKNSGVADSLNDNSKENQSLSEDAAINSGDANATLNAVNDSNTNITGENWKLVVQNITDPYVGDIDLNKDFQNIIDNAKNDSSSSNNESAPQSLTINNTNNSDTTNNYTVSADSGNNSITGTTDEHTSADATIETGDATASANIVNLLNKNIVGSNWLLEVVNVFGKWIGNLIVPDEGSITTPTVDSLGNVTVNNQNTLTENNNVTSNATTGENTANAENALITTGNASSTVTITDQNNTNIVKNNWFMLLINNMGKWTGQVLNWNSTTNSYDKTYQYDFASDPLSAASVSNNGTDLTVNNINNAVVNNNVNVNANTGENSINNTNGTAKITTGDATALTKIFNMVNTNIVGSNWLFVIVNIFGSWNGNVVFGEDVPNTDNNEPDEENVDEIDPEEDFNDEEELDIIEINSVKEGKLKLTRSDDISGTAQAGQIVTENITVKNNGKDTVYKTIMIDALYDSSGQKISQYAWELGTLKKGEALKVSYQLQLGNLPPGKYTFEAISAGKDRYNNFITSKPQNKSFSMIAQNSFAPFGETTETPLENTETLGAEEIKPEEQKVFAAIADQNKFPFEKFFLPIWASLFAGYLSLAHWDQVQNTYRKTKHLLNLKITKGKLN